LTQEGLLIKAVSGFYTVRCATETIECRARGRFRMDGSTPLVGDHVQIEAQADKTGTVLEILPRRSSFGRPAVANIDNLVMIISATIPITDPYLADRITVRCEKNGCGAVIVINKCDLNPGNDLFEIYQTTGYPLVRTSALTGEGIDELRQVISGKVCCFTGNSGVGKSSILNALDDSFSIQTGDVSRKLGRGRHTTRHVELYDLGGNTYIADTPGFSSFDGDTDEPILKQELAGLFPEFGPYRNRCRFDDCAHMSEPDCAVRQAIADGAIHPSRYESYRKIYAEAALIRDWELK